MVGHDHVTPDTVRVLLLMIGVWALAGVLGFGVLVLAVVLPELLELLPVLAVVLELEVLLLELLALLELELELELELLEPATGTSAEVLSLVELALLSRANNSFCPSFKV